MGTEVCRICMGLGTISTQHEDTGQWFEIHCPYCDQGMERLKKRCDMTLREFLHTPEFKKLVKEGPHGKKGNPN